MLLARAADGELPPFEEDRAVTDATRAISDLPPERTAALHARAMFGPRSLSAHAMAIARLTHDLFFAELALALGISARVLIASVRAGQLPLIGPCTIADYEYLGTFRTSGTLFVCDPCYLKRSGPLCTKVRHALEGTWHVYVRPGTGSDAAYTAELVVAHEAGLDVAALEKIALVGVDAGLAGVYDEECPKPNLDREVEEGPFAGRGAHSRSGYGDGGYTALAGRREGKVVKIRIPFLDGEDEDRSTSTSDAPARRYSIRERFEPGERIEHSKFGRGLVLSASAEKVEVQFADGTRTLVHGKS